jgi:hypothetical protein
MNWFVQCDIIRQMLIDAKLNRLKQYVLRLSNS